HHGRAPRPGRVGGHRRRDHRAGGAAGGGDRAPVPAAVPGRCDLVPRTRRTGEEHGMTNLAAVGRTAPPPDLSGLPAGEAAARLRRDGGNVLPQRRPTPLWRRVLAQVRDPLVLVLLAAAGFTLATGDLTDAAVILFVVVV